MIDRAGSVQSAYSARAGEYISALGSIHHAAAPDLALIEEWPRRVKGPAIDVGCGPGQWTHHLADLGVEIEGIDPVPEFIESAQDTYPGVPYRIARAEALGVADSVLGGVLAWYSLIHTEPERIGAALTEFARCLRPSSLLILGFFTGPRLETFEHAITTAYYWPVDLLAAEVESAGFDVTHIETRTDVGARPHGAIIAERLTC